MYSIELCSIFIITLSYVRNPCADENFIVADAVLTPKEKQKQFLPQRTYSQSAK